MRFSLLSAELYSRSDLADDLLATSAALCGVTAGTAVPGGRAAP